MRPLNYETLKETGTQGYLLPEAPERVLQFGEGNFLRAFVDDFVDIANERQGFDTKVLVVQPIAGGRADAINRQQGLYTLYLRGFEDGKTLEEKRVISCLSRCLQLEQDYDDFLAAAENPALRYIVSNTTEAGIVYDGASRFEDIPPAAFPAKLTRFLYARYQAAQQKDLGGLVVMPCELIDDNGQVLARCVRQYIDLWKLEPAFACWVEAEVLFCSTLVDRIVTGYPANEAEALNQANGYTDEQLCTAETFGLWVIEGPESLAAELPFARAGLPVLVTRDHTPYKQRKVRILNGAHTTMCLAAYLAGQDIVRDCMQDPTLYAFTRNAIFAEIMPTLTLPQEELAVFAEAVLDRFRNPFIDHRLLSISLNSVSKWRARVLPSVKGYIAQNKKAPPRLTFGFAALLAFYHGNILENGALTGHRGEEDYSIQDDVPVLAFFAGVDQRDPTFVQAACERTDFWGEDLNALPSFTDAVAAHLHAIQTQGMGEALAALEASLS